ncbi:hypothetical protein AY601_0451 [Pedobacter cryoconitis]|uniref:Uncharacterized protein n=1 Tax=Pedobacter cryoconitis TaxID=188932 RepID=A0A127V834_9SPHI|nr:hypothetical protein [Pedobacter cryoconitis]AMP97407.1 hypothetical protein AY601_0451 [Pedobacter cryoconitis]
MNNQQTPEKTVIDEVVESLIKRTELLEKEQLVKNEVLLAKEKETQALLASFDSKYSNIVIQAPKPDMSGVTAELFRSLTDIKETIEKWQKPLKKEYRITLFPEQLRSVEYVRAVLTRLILGFIGLVFLIFTYLLMNKYIQ